MVLCRIEEEENQGGDWLDFDEDVFPGLRKDLIDEALETLVDEGYIKKCYDCYRIRQKGWVLISSFRYHPELVYIDPGYELLPEDSGWTSQHS